MFNRENLFGNRREAPPGQTQPGQAPRQPSRQTQPRYADDPRQGYPEKPRGGQRMRLQPCKCPQEWVFSNVCGVSTQDVGGQGGEETYLLMNDRYVVTARSHPQIQRGQIGMNDFQRTWMQVALTDTVEAEVFDPFRQGGQAYLGNMDVEIGYATRTAPPNVPPFDQDQLAEHLINTLQNQIFAPGQTFGLDARVAKLKLQVKTVELVDLSRMEQAGEQQTHPQARGILTPQTTINFFKDAKSPIQLKGSNKRPAANAVIRPDFKFESLGIGGLDKEFSDIFRRAFASRIFPPGLADKLGIQHVRGILLYGPPGTGKTLIARQIGKMLNAREPKVINGPEVLNKYVGQSEENVRKLFADAEKEQKEKGDESGLHIIIFDELDAVCKQRGSGAGGGTGVGDSVVNQLLSKLDGVEQLNNLLLIGMTNRKDMIDEALLRSGRLEVHMEISLPDEPGRQQILKIHTTKMAENGKLASDVDLAELARRTRNFSGAEISGLVKSASSFALQRHIKGGTVAALSDDINEMQIHMQDFVSALQEVKPLFGVNDEALEVATRKGIIHFGPQIDKIIKYGGDYVRQVRSGDTELLSVLLHGPSKSGLTAMAAHIAQKSEFPFIKLVRPVDMAGMNEIQKIQHLSKIFTDAYKSPSNLLVLDDIDLMLDWVPVGPRFSSAVLAALKGFMNNPPPKDRPLLIFATCSKRTVLQQLELEFDAEIAVPYLRSAQELGAVMQHSGQFDDDGIRKALSDIQQTTGSSEINVGIKQILTLIETAQRDEDPVARFVDGMCDVVNRNRAFVS
ncbi:Vesicular-fusion sec18 [Lecanosticta acicola]|uniref:Vesicular-fusion protein SEC18 n=1 Tax=Lecanosticta acicola TaxID=111012 RepID=A0AAI9EFF2_9PEZI|nr:Vesicular-fusion sec18 [Lecanosticta acicola]